ncbi:MsnO8 family LLM class oxidoreductase [Streptomyces sp. SID2999]|uniref:LLM class flavin-dependent oxidoreductase n=1 Tax=Streptomyces sp. SID2999 TaxID=2690258 RepID=UPI001370EDED|nr:LLM class flavin-dependent oxidoreductase [Streptomyces sp. SID2999]MYZ08990.1 MsnO8 family LLM class oxidoreductase [Streptomyces sp. SID2999]
MTTPRVPLSILDLVPVASGTDTTTALNQSVELARLADSLGYHRYWYAEHHNVVTFASSATSLLIGRAAEHTERIRLGSGGVMLPNHSPLMVAEYYGTLAEMYGDRIDLGLGRAPGTDPTTAAALRRGAAATDTFVEDVVELHRYLGSRDGGPGSVKALPGRGTEVPLWMLGSSLDGAAVAAYLGLPYAFASHFAPQLRHQALALYRSRFSTEFSTAEIKRPYAMVGVNVLVAPTDDEARYLFTTAQQMAAGIYTGRRGPLQPPVKDLEAVLGPEAAHFVDDFQQVRAVGSPQTVVAELEAIVADLEADEVIITTYTHDPAHRSRSFALLAEAWGLDSHAE